MMDMYREERAGNGESGDGSGIAGWREREPGRNVGAATHVKN